MNLAQAMSASLIIRRHVPPHLIAQFDALTELAFRSASADLIGEIVDRDTDKLADLISLEWHRERTGA